LLTSLDSVASFQVLGVSRRNPTQNLMQRESKPCRVNGSRSQSTAEHPDVTSNKQINDLCWWRATLLCTAYFQRLNLFLLPKENNMSIGIRLRAAGENGLNKLSKLCCFIQGMLTRKSLQTCISLYILVMLTVKMAAHRHI